MPKQITNVKNQHYVWRYYLAAWSEPSFYCLRQKDKHIFSTDPQAIARERYFYQSKPLTEDDLKFLGDFLSKATIPLLRQLNEEWVELIQRPYQIKKILAGQRIPEATQKALDEELLLVERNLIERYHAAVENGSTSILMALKEKKVDFYLDEKLCGAFLHFLTLQYFRTAKMIRVFAGIGGHLPNHDPSRTAGILSLVAATNTGASLFLEKSAYRIVFLTNPTQTPFISGDQPVINMLNPASTDDVELYYPLSPNLALLLTKDILKQYERELSIFEVELYNYAIFNRSDDQIYSNDENYLSSFLSLEKGIQVYADEGLSQSNLT